MLLGSETAFVLTQLRVIVFTPYAGKKLNKLVPSAEGASERKSGFQLVEPNVLKTI